MKSTEVDKVRANPDQGKERTSTGIESRRAPPNLMLRYLGTQWGTHLGTVTTLVLDIRGQRGRSHSLYHGWYSVRDLSGDTVQIPIHFSSYYKHKKLSTILVSPRSVFPTVLLITVNLCRCNCGDAVRQENFRELRAYPF